MNISIHTIFFATVVIALLFVAGLLIRLIFKRFFQKKPGARWRLTLLSIFGLTISSALLYQPIMHTLDPLLYRDIKIDAYEYYADLADDHGKSYDAGGAHITYFLGWAIERGLASHALGFDDARNVSEPETMGPEAIETITRFKQEGDEGIESLLTYSEWLFSSMLTPDGATFAKAHFNTYKQRYFKVMEDKFGDNIQEISAEKYRLAKQILDGMFRDYINQAP